MPNSCMHNLQYRSRSLSDGFVDILWVVVSAEHILSSYSSIAVLAVPSSHLAAGPCMLGLTTEGQLLAL